MKQIGNTPEEIRASLTELINLVKASPAIVSSAEATIYSEWLRDPFAPKQNIKPLTSERYMHYVHSPRTMYAELLHALSSATECVVMSDLKYVDAMYFELGCVIRVACSDGTQTTICCSKNEDRNTTINDHLQEYMDNKLNKAICATMGAWNLYEHLQKQQLLTL